MYTISNVAARKTENLVNPKWVCVMCNFVVILCNGFVQCQFRIYVNRKRLVVSRHFQYRIFKYCIHKYCIENITQTNFGLNRFSVALATAFEIVHTPSQCRGHLSFFIILLFSEPIDYGPQHFAWVSQMLRLQFCRNILLGLACNESISDVKLDLSSNHLGIAGAQILDSCIHGVRCISSLNIADNGKGAVQDRSYN